MANTTNFNFELIDFDTIPWHTKEHDNWRLADAVFSQYISISGVKGVWSNSIAVAIDDKYVDAELGTIWTALVAHTTASSGTFAADRATNTSFWESFSIAQSFKGTWATGTTYAVNDFVVDGHQYAVATSSHTSGATFAGDSDKWTILVDVTSSVTAAAASATAASASQTAAATSATAASSSASAAASSATASASSASTASTQATNASNSATSASTSATTASNAASAVASPFTFDNGTTMADPGTGEFRLNHATPASVSLVAFSNTTGDSADISPYIVTWDDSSSTINGIITLIKQGTPATFAIYQVGAVTDNTAWLQVGVTHVASNGSFSNGDVARIQYTRTGDIGATGPTGPVGIGLSLALGG